MNYESIETTDRISITEDKLLEMLIDIQNKSRFKYVSREDIKNVASALGINEIRAYEVATFYSMISTEPRGENIIQICQSPACHTAGGRNIVKIFEEVLDIKMGQTTDDRLITLEYTSCIGACDIAPAAKVNNETIGNLNRVRIEKLVEIIREVANRNG